MGVLPSLAGNDSDVATKAVSMAGCGAGVNSRSGAGYAVKCFNCHIFEFFRNFRNNYWIEKHSYAIIFLTGLSLLFQS